MEKLIGFSLVVGIGSTLVLDLWVILVKKLLGMPPTDWGMVGRWLQGLAQGKLLLDTRIERSPNLSEKALGWLFHYLIGIAYAVLLLLIWGRGFADTPEIGPIVIVGIIFSSLAGLTVLMPAMGGGIFGRKLANQTAILIYVVVAHTAFAAGQYGFALISSGI